MIFWIRVYAVGKFTELTRIIHAIRIVSMRDVETCRYITIFIHICGIFMGVRDLKIQAFYNEADTQR